MQHNSQSYRSHCPINFILESLGDKWTLLVVRDLLFKGKRYYGEFLASDENISTNILANRLEKLETNGIVSKRIDPEHKSKIIYSLTEKGKKLLPMMLEMTYWSSQYDNCSNVDPAFAKEFERNKEGLIKRFLEMS